MYILYTFGLDLGAFQNSVLPSVHLSIYLRAIAWAQTHREVPLYTPLMEARERRGSSLSYNIYLVIYYPSSEFKMRIGSPFRIFYRSQSTMSILC
jgi:hypothetical protein